MSNRERQQYIENMEKELSTLAYQDQRKIMFAKRFVNDLHLFKSEDGNRIQIGPVDVRMLEYFIYSILVDYERVAWES